MATLVTLERQPAPGSVQGGAPLVLVAVSVACLSAFLAGWLPLGFSIITVFLFAGPHNWIEARYFLKRMPARWGRLRPFFLTAFGGIFGLTAIYAALPWFYSYFGWSGWEWQFAAAAWNSALVIWILALIQMRSRQNPRRDWFWTLPVGFLLMALTWLWPTAWGLGIVYLHPLMAFWILDRELKRSKPQWRPAFHKSLICVPLLLGLLWWQLASAPPLPGEDALTWRITQHAGAEIVQGVSSHLLVATHTFLEMLHYGIWLVAIPLVAFRSAPWQMREVPLARRAPSWRLFVIGLLCLGGLMVLLLWSFFIADYPITRDVYFTVALLHVLAEIPFLLRAL
jgi:hypothetical protein